MKTFLEWVKSSLLPPIPNGMIRLTHFTPTEKNAESIINNGLRYSKQGYLPSTTDPHTTNEQVIKTITAHAVGSVDRSQFGSYVVLIDMPYNYFKMLNGLGFEMKNDTIPPTQVLGYLHREDINLKKNPIYSPNKMTQPISLNRTFGFGSEDDDDTKGMSQVNAPKEYDPSDIVF